MQFKTTSLGCQGSRIPTKHSSMCVPSGYGCTRHLVTPFATCSRTNTNCVVILEHDFMRHHVHHAVMLKILEELILKYWNILSSVQEFVAKGHYILYYYILYNILYTSIIFISIDELFKNIDISLRWNAEHLDHKLVTKGFWKGREW